MAIGASRTADILPDSLRSQSATTLCQGLAPTLFCQRSEFVV